MSASSRAFLRVAVPVPARTVFDYRAPGAGPVANPGCRVRVPFGRRQLVGLVIEQVSATEVPDSRLREVIEVLDPEPILPPALLGLLMWASDYYHHSPGEVIRAALPALLRQGRAAELRASRRWVITRSGAELDPGQPARAPLQRRVLAALRAAEDGLPAEALTQISTGWRKAMDVLARAGWVEERSEAMVPPVAQSGVSHKLNPGQQAAADAVPLQGYSCQLLFGITGSGKTEVYIELAARALGRGRQVLVLVPEIGLTPQLVERFRRALPEPVVALHSGLGDVERLAAWMLARTGKAGVILGTRSAVFTPFRDLGLIIVDEEHDGSYKQQEGFRYHARDVAVMRASRESIPVLLGSATPSLESLYQAERGRYQLLVLNERATRGELPRIEVLDMKRLAANDGLSHPLVQAVRSRLGTGEQSLLFLNRRGYAPVLMCYDCGWIAQCRRCDARLTLHHGQKRLRCHHCGAEQPLPQTCPQCESERVRPLGEGTERVEQALAKVFPQARIIRIDRDTTRRKGALEESLQRIHAGEADILVGTQMLAKGHDFPGITLVGVLNVDQGLYGSDFRAAEFLAQQVIQVSGRAGRGDRPGEVMIQTWHPRHPVFAALQRHDYRGFSEYELTQRREAAYPPFAYLTLLRAESKQKGEALAMLEQAREQAPPLPAGVRLSPALPSLMERRAGYHRAQLLVQADERRVLHPFLHAWLAAIENLPLARRVRWSVDVDPMEMF
jgi:primosomal protein N' (replication factor Y)